MNVLRWHIGNLHVSTSDREILRDMWNRLNKTPSNMTLENRDERKKVYRLALEYHHENQQLYRDVMTGNL